MSKKRPSGWHLLTALGSVFMYLYLRSEEKMVSDCGGRGYDIVPGKPYRSTWMYRIEPADPSIALVGVAKQMVPVEAASVVRRWIAEMKKE